MRARQLRSIWDAVIRRAPVRGVLLPAQETLGHDDPKHSADAATGSEVGNARAFGQSTTRRSVSSHVGLAPHTAEEPRTSQQDRHVRLRVSVSVATLVLVGLPMALPASAPLFPVYETLRGGFLRTTLSDGSQLELNTASQVQERFTRDRRVVILARGEAFLKVNPRDWRPFSVLVGGLTLEAEDTSLSVRRILTGKALIWVGAGAVRVHRAVRPEPAADLLSADMSRVARYTVLLAGDTLSVQIISPVESTCGLAWRQREICFANSTLVDAVAELNRYSERQLVIGDPTLGRLRIGGAFSEADTSAFTQLLSRLFGIVAAETTPNRLVLFQGCPSLQPHTGAQKSRDPTAAIDSFRCGVG